MNYKLMKADELREAETNYLKLLREQIELECYEELEQKMDQFSQKIIEKADHFLKIHLDGFYESLLDGKGPEAKRKLVNELRQIIREEYVDAKTAFEKTQENSETASK